MNLHHEREPSWYEPIRFVIAVLWVVVLTLWTFYQALWFHCHPAPSTNTLYAASSILRAVRPLWFASLFPSLAFGVSWYAFTHLVRRTPTRLNAPDRLTISHTYGSLCVAICAFVLLYRILVLIPFVLCGGFHPSSQLLALTWDVWSPAPPIVEFQALIGALAAALAAAQAWGVLPRLGGSRRQLLAILGLLLSLGCAAAAPGVLEMLPSPVPRVVSELDLRSPTTRGVLLDDEDHRDEARIALATYLATHDDEGTVVPLNRLRNDWVRGWEELPEEELAHRRCELCFLPGVAVWTMTGLPLRLTDSPPTDPMATNVIEIPRRPGYGRLYDPREAVAVHTMPIGDLPDALGGSDWVSVKIDFSVPIRVVRDLLSGLREHGVRRVDLAVIPYGFRPLPKDAPMLSFDALRETASYTPRDVWRRSGFIAKTSVTPSPDIEQRPRCEMVSRWDYEQAWIRWDLDPDGSLPARIGLPVDSDTAYGEFIGLLQGILTGGAKTIVVEVQEAEE